MEPIEVLKRILAEPYGCPMCDSGKLRNPEKQHWDDCPYLLAEKAISQDAAQVHEWEFKFFPNHGDEDGRNSFTICFSGKDEFGDDDYDDAVITGAVDTEDEAKEACERLNNILRSQLSAAHEEIKRLREELMATIRGFLLQNIGKEMKNDLKSRLEELKTKEGSHEL